MYKIKVNDKFPFEIDLNGSEIHLNQKLLQVDFSDSGNVIYHDKSFNTEVMELNKAGKFCIIKVNGNIYKVDVEDQFDQLLKQLGLDNQAVNKVVEVRAPMPGLVLDVRVIEGEEISKGDNLLILEAMKMENILKSSTNGVIKKILVKQGDKVEKNQILIQFK